MERGGDGYSYKPYMPNQSFKQWGIFTEASWQQTDNQRWVAGLRHDQVKAHYDTARVTDPVLKHQKIQFELRLPALGKKYGQRPEILCRLRYCRTRT